MGRGVFSQAYRSIIFSRFSMYVLYLWNVTWNNDMRVYRECCFFRNVALCIVTCMYVYVS